MRNAVGPSVVAERLLQLRSVIRMLRSWSAVPFEMENTNAFVNTRECSESTNNRDVIYGGPRSQNLVSIFVKEKDQMDNAIQRLTRLEWMIEMSRLRC